MFVPARRLHIAQVPLLMLHQHILSIKSVDRVALVLRCLQQFLQLGGVYLILMSQERLWVAMEWAQSSLYHAPGPKLVMLLNYRFIICRTVVKCRQYTDSLKAGAPHSVTRRVYVTLRSSLLKMCTEIDCLVVCSCKLMVQGKIRTGPQKSCLIEHPIKTSNREYIYIVVTIYSRHPFLRQKASFDFHLLPALSSYCPHEWHSATGLQAGIR